MFTIIFIILMFAVFGKMISFSIRATWGIAKVLLTLVLLPLVLVGMVAGGLVFLAIPVLIVVGVVSLVCNSAS